MGTWETSNGPFGDLEQGPLLKALGLTDLTARFFGVIAANWAGLVSGAETRRRLDDFYNKQRTSKPDWAVKLDRRVRGTVDVGV